MLYTKLVLTGRIPLERLLDAMSTAPRRIFRIPEAPDDRVFIDLEKEFTIDSGTFLSMGKATPFEGWRVNGRCVETLYRGNAVWRAA